MNATRSTARKKASTKKRSKPAAKTTKKKSAVTKAAELQKKKRKKGKKGGKSDKLQPALRQCVADALTRYFKDMDGHDPNGMYRLVMDEVEAPLLDTVMQQCEGNQTRAAAILGINRATLRKKLRQHRIL